MKITIEQIIIILLLSIPFLLYFVNFKKQDNKKGVYKQENFWSYISHPIKYLYGDVNGFGQWFGPWNNPLRSTRNMSYDLRGDVPVAKYNISPWLNSSLMPIYNKPLWMVS